MKTGPVVYIVDDDPAVRSSLTWLLESVNFQVQAFENAESFLTAYDRNRPGCLLLDVRMPGMSGMELQVRLSAESIELPVVIVTGHADVPMAVRCFKQGAFDFIEKPFNDQVMLDHVNRAIEKDCRRIDTGAGIAEIRRKMALLTPRELEVFELVVEGKSNKEVAHALGLSPKTVEVHRAHVMSKMGARSLPELVKFAVSVQAPAGL